MSDLEKKLDDHIAKTEAVFEAAAQGSYVLPNGLTVGEQLARTDKLEENQELMLDEMLGSKHPLTHVRQGGMKGDLGWVRKAMLRFERKEENGGVHAKVKFTFWQKSAIAAVPFVTAGIFGIILALIERQ